MAGRIYVNRQKLFTPKLSAFYLTLGEPKFYNSDDKEGGYSVSLSADPDDVTDFRIQMEAMAEELYQEYLDASGKKKLQRREPLIPMKNEEDRDGNETGNLLFKFNTKAHRKQKDGRLYPVDVPVVDTQGNRLPTDKITRLGRGTEMVVSFDAKAYYMSGIFGITWTLRAVQVHNPVWRESSPAEDFAGVTAEGYVMDDNEAALSDFGD